MFVACHTTGSFAPRQEFQCTQCTLCHSPRTSASLHQKSGRLVTLAVDVLRIPGDHSAKLDDMRKHGERFLFSSM